MKHQGIRGVYSGGSRGGGDVRPPPPKNEKKQREREGEGGSSVPQLNKSASAFIHSPVKCNKSLYIFYPLHCPFSLSNYF